jgi:hypothetical protein
VFTLLAISHDGTSRGAALASPVMICTAMENCVFIAILILLE